MTLSASSPLRIGLLQARAPGHHISGQGTGPPFGLLSIAAYSRARYPGHLDFELLDSYFFTSREISRWLTMTSLTAVRPMMMVGLASEKRWPG